MSWACAVSWSYPPKWEGLLSLPSDPGAECFRHSHWLIAHKKSPERGGTSEVRGKCALFGWFLLSLYTNTGSFTAKLCQILKQFWSLYLIQIVPENGKRGKLTNIFYEASLILIPAPDKYTKRQERCRPVLLIRRDMKNTKWTIKLVETTSVHKNASIMLSERHSQKDKYYVIPFIWGYLE